MITINGKGENATKVTFHDTINEIMILKMNADAPFITLVIL